MNGNNKEQVITRDIIYDFKTYSIHTDDVMDELHHDRNHEYFTIMYDYLPTTDAGNAQFEVE